MDAGLEICASQENDSPCGTLFVVDLELQPLVAKCVDALPTSSVTRWGILQPGRRLCASPLGRWGGVPDTLSSLCGCL